MKRGFNIKASWLEIAAILLIGPAVFLAQAAVVVAQNPQVSLQSWWRAGTGEPGPESTHLHVESDIKLDGVPVAGPISFNVTAVVHHAIPGSKLRSTKIYSEPLHKVVFRIDWNQTLGGEVNWSGTRPVSFNTTACAYDGRQELRLLTDMVDGHGNAQVTTSGLQIVTANGLPVKHARAANWNEARAYYVSGYQNARFLSPLPRDPVSGVWSPYLQITDGSGGRPTDRHQILLDMGNHGHIPGTVLRDAPGRFAKQRFPIDTSTMTPGWHKLFLIGHESDQSSSDPTRRGTVSVVLVIPFEVSP